MKKIIMFHGRECPHCRVMHPIVDRLIAEGCRIEKLEVWHDENNAKKMRDFSDIIRAASGGDLPVSDRWTQYEVPFKIAKADEKASIYIEFFTLRKDQGNAVISDVALYKE